MLSGGDCARRTSMVWRRSVSPASSTVGVKTVGAAARQRQFAGELEVFGTLQDAEPAGRALQIPDAVIEPQIVINQGKAAGVESHCGHDLVSPARSRDRRRSADRDWDRRCRQRPVDAVRRRCYVDPGVRRRCGTPLRPCHVDTAVGVHCDSRETLGSKRGSRWCSDRRANS